MLILAGDASLRLISPLSGTSLATAMPYMSMIDPLSSVYSSELGIFTTINYLDKIWLLMKTGEMCVYDTASNPMSINSQWYFEYGIIIPPLISR
jgi:hypothetical protein